mmetsp:Transcript_35360/g.54125  ORF Transcript_35360/g.54125 Transcript_35360/m.54125 type:complete len:152 (+) Transcript_35360:962-1417(+)
MAVNKIYPSDTPATLTEIRIGTLPSKPLNVERELTSFTSGEIQISWEAPEDFGGVDMVSYEVWVDDGDGTFTSATATPTYPTTTLTLTGLTDLKTYGIKLFAINEIGTGETSSDIVYLACASVPATPDAPTEESSTRTTITLTWNEPTSST